MEVENSIFFAEVEERLREGQRVTIRMRGTSMTPLLRESDKVTLAPLGGEPQVGDVLLFRYGRLHILHRLVAREGDRLVMQGDFCVGHEEIRRADVVGRLDSVHRRNGQSIGVGSAEWNRLSSRSLQLKKARNAGRRWLGRKGRRQLRPWYLALLVILMWAPLNGLDIPLDNYILGLRADHLLHASVFLPMAIFVFDLTPRRWWLGWLASCLIGLVTECGQYLLPYRAFDINDMVANFIGVSLGWLALKLFFSHFRKK